MALARRWRNETALDSCLTLLFGITLMSIIMRIIPAREDIGIGTKEAQKRHKRLLERTAYAKICEDLVELSTCMESTGEFGHRT